jgi:hypothetical protein
MLTWSSIEFYILNCLAEITMFWFGASEKSWKVNSGNVKMKLYNVGLKRSIKKFSLAIKNDFGLLDM